MKIFDKKAFMDLPVGTVYCHFEPCVLWDLCIKLENIGTDDFYYQDILTSFDVEDHDLDVIKTYNPCFDSELRECLYDESKLYAVWSKDDVKKLIKRLEETLT